MTTSGSIPGKLAALTAAAATAALLLGGCAVGPEDAVAVGEATPVETEGASHPTAAISAAEGRAYVAWVGMREGRYDVYLAAAEAEAERFGSPVRVNDVPGDASPHEQAPAQVATGPGGEVYVLWQNNTPIEGRRFPASDLRLAVSTDGGRSFAPAVTVNDDAGELPSSHTFHAMAVGGDGSVFVSWIDSREHDRARAAGLDESAIKGGPEIRIARSTDQGRTFSASVVVDTNSCPCCRTALAAGPDGSVYVAWRKIYDGDVRDIALARVDGGTLRVEPPVRIHADEWVFPGCPHAGPSLAFDEEGRLHAAWYTGREGRQGLWHAVSPDGGRSFGAPAAVLTGDWVPPSQVALALSEAGMWVGWEDRTAEPAVVRLSRVGDGGPLLKVGAAVGAGRAPALVGRNGAALIAWLDGEAVHARWARGAGR